MGRDADMGHDLDQKLTAYAASDIYPFHMPGHKRQRLGDWRPEEQTEMTAIFDKFMDMVGRG